MSLPCICINVQSHNSAPGLQASSSKMILMSKLTRCHHHVQLSSCAMLAPPPWQACQPDQSRWSPWCMHGCQPPLLDRHLLQRIAGVQALPLGIPCTQRGCTIRCFLPVTLSDLLELKASYLLEVIAEDSI